MPDEPLLDLSEAARLLGVSTVWLHRAAKRGDVEAVWVKNHWRFTAEQLKAAESLLRLKARRRGRTK